MTRILRYLGGTLSYGLVFQTSEQLQLHGFSDSDWCSDLVDKKSTLGIVIYLASNPIM